MKTRHAAMALLVLAGTAPARAADDALSEARLAPVRKYIKDGWTTLTRGPRDLVRGGARPEAAPAAGHALARLRLGPRGPRAGGARARRRSSRPSERKQIELRVLPEGPARP